MGDDRHSSVLCAETTSGRQGLWRIHHGIGENDRLPWEILSAHRSGQIVDIPFIQARFGHLRIHLTAARLLSDMGAGFACLFRIRFRILLSRLRHAGA
jgi:hypothetical protein